MFSPPKAREKACSDFDNIFHLKMLLDDSNDNYSFEIALVHQSRTYLFILL